MNRASILLLPLLAAPASASAASVAGAGCNSVLSSLHCLAQGIGNILGYGTGILIGIAIIFYFWGIVRRLWDVNAGDAKSFTAIRTQLLWGLVALFVALSLWGILSLLGTALFGTNNFNSLF